MSCIVDQTSRCRISLNRWSCPVPPRIARRHPCKSCIPASTQPGTGVTARAAQRRRRRREARGPAPGCGRRAVGTGQPHQAVVPWARRGSVGAAGRSTSQRSSAQRPRAVGGPHPPANRWSRPNSQPLPPVARRLLARTPPQRRPARLRRLQVRRATVVRVAPNIRRCGRTLLVRATAGTGQTQAHHASGPGCRLGPAPRRINQPQAMGGARICGASLVAGASVIASEECYRAAGGIRKPDSSCRTGGRRPADDAGH